MTGVGRASELKPVSEISNRRSDQRFMDMARVQPHEQIDILSRAGLWSKTELQCQAAF